MNQKLRTTFIILSVAVPFLLYCVYYYSHMIKNAPYKFSEFKSFTIKYGTADSMLNTYNSATGAYQYLNKHDSLIKLNMPLGSNNLLYLHRKAADLGFWDFPETEIGDTTIRIHGARPLRYRIAFYYKRKNKIVVYDESFEADARLKAANEQVVKEIMHVLNDEENKQKN